MFIAAARSSTGSPARQSPCVGVGSDCRSR